MYLYGGVYADIDFECLQPLDFVQKVVTGFLSSEPTDHTMVIYGVPIVVCNAILGSSPAHPFWLHVMDRITKKIESGDSSCTGDINYCTGPQMLQQVYRDYIRNMENEPISVLPSELFYPEIADYNPELRKKCKEMKEAGMYTCKMDMPINSGIGSKDTLVPIAVHHWSCQWCRAHTTVQYVPITDVVPARQLRRPFAKKQKAFD